MADIDELQWVKSTANELNNLLQVISETSQYLQRACTGNADAQRYAEMMRNALDRATHLSKTMLDRASNARREPPTAAAGQTGVAGAARPFPAPGQFALPEQKPTHFAASENARSRDVKIVNPDGPRELILIVDDEDFVTLLAQRVLTDEGYRVVTAKDGFTALDLFKKLQDQIGLVILDFTMPIMDGSEVFSELRMINPHVPVVLSSGFTEQDKLKWMLARGLRGFIPKPYTQQKLLLQVRTALDAIKS